MSSITHLTTPDGNTLAFQDVVSHYTTNQGNVSNITAGAGLISTAEEETLGLNNGGIACNLKSYIASTLTAASRTSTSNREYAVGLDKNGVLAVNVPWVNTTYGMSGNIVISNSGEMDVITGDGLTDSWGTSNASKNISNNTWTYVGNATVPKFAVGKYIITAMINWNGRADGTAAQTKQGYRWLEIASSKATNSAVNRFAYSTMKAWTSESSSNVMQEVVFFWSNTTANTALYLNAWQNSGITLTYNYAGMQWFQISK